jgi:hypothetical protein
MTYRLTAFFQFLARYALYLVVPGLWFAYIGGVSPWIGGVAGFIAAALIGLSVLITMRQGRASRGESRRDALEELLTGG